MNNEKKEVAEKWRLKSSTELEFRAKRLKDKFNFKTEESRKKVVSPRLKMEFDSDIESMLSPANELLFVTTGDNKDYAAELFKSVQKLLVSGNKIILSDGTNEEMDELVQKECTKILKLLIVIMDNDTEFKPFLKTEKHFFDESIFVEIAKKIKLSNDVSVFMNELNGGDTALKIKEALHNPTDKEIFLYGVDRDIDCGAESRDKGIETARGGIYEASSFWSDISFCANHQVSFNYSWSNYYDAELYDFYRKRYMRNKGIFIFNYPFYRVNDIKNILRNNELLFALNTGDEIGNIVFVMKYGNGNVTKSKSEMQKIEFKTDRLPKDLSQMKIDYYTENIEELKTFRGKYIDLDDIKVEFKGQEESSEFLFEYFEPKNKLQNLSKPLMEYKAGHIPAMATSEIINGRYVDEILEEKTGKKFEFDHLFSTKIVKREIEEKESKIDSSGNKIVEISEKKSNVIVSIALTADGEYIELFSNAEEKKETK